MKKERRSLFSMIFGNRPQNGPETNTQLRMLNGYIPVFSQFGTEAYNSDDVRAAVDAIARNAAKMRPKHIRRNTSDQSVTLVDDGLQYLLGVQPNPFMDSYTFFYKVVTLWAVQNNAFIYIQKDDSGNITGFYPLNAGDVELIECQNEVWARFLFLGGQKIVIPYSDLIHLRRFFYKDDFFGETNMTALQPTLEVINASNQGIINAIKSSAFLRGILRFVQVMKREDRISRTKDFVTDYMGVSNNGGIAALDGTAEYTELKNDPKMTNAAQMQFISKKVCRYFGISEAIVSGDFTEQQWNAAYESVWEPLAVQMSLQFTAKCFSGREQNFGNEIIFESNRLQYASNATKVAVGTFLTNIGAASLDQILDMFNMPTIGGDAGSRRVQTLNVVNADKADQYQGVGSSPTPKEGEPKK